MKINTTQFRLGRYSAMTAGIILGSDVHGQVAYTDLDPDKIFAPWLDETFYVDFNADGITDLTFHQDIWIDMYCDSTSTGVWCTGTTYQNVDAYGASVDFVNDIVGSSLYFLPSATPLLAGTEISIDANWNGSGFARLFDNNGEWTYSYSDWWGEWTNVWWGMQFGQWQDIEEHKYLGVEFLIDGQTHYGWVELSADRGDKVFQSFRIYSFAYETMPNVAIVAGFIPACFPPEPLAPVAITGTTAKIKWNTLDSVDHFELQYRPVGALSWTTKTVAGVKSFRKVAGLTCDTEYEWRIRSFCLDGEVSLYSEVQNFSTVSCRFAEDEPEVNEPATVYSFGQQIYILFDEENPTEWLYSVYDMYGNLMLEDRLNDFESVINTSLPSGMYIVVLENDGRNFATQIGLFH